MIQVLIFCYYLDDNINGGYFLGYKYTKNWLLFSLFSSLLRKEGRIKEEYVSKTGFQTFFVNLKVFTI